MPAWLQGSWRVAMHDGVGGDQPSSVSVENLNTKAVEPNGTTGLDFGCNS
jgi:hypothetical protein